MFEYFLLPLLLLAAILLLSSPISNESNSGKAEKQNMSSTLISVIVPCIPRDIPKLTNLISNINNQTLKPSEVIVALSQTNPVEGNKIQEKLNKQAMGYKVMVVPTTEVMYAGANRNRGVKEATGDYIAFIDADDTMSPYRLEYVTYYLKKLGNKPSVLLHGFRQSHGPTAMSNAEDKLAFTTGNVNITNAKDMYRLRKRKPYHITHRIYGKHIAHGHAIVKRDVFDHSMYTEKFRKGEDTQFINRLFDHYKDNENGIYHIDLNLTNYVPSEN